MMFNFPLLRALSIVPVPTFELDDLMNEYFGNKSVDLTDAKILDVYAYAVEGIQYEQKVYRLKNNSIYVETKPNAGVSIIQLEKELREAVIAQQFEKAATIRDKIKSLK